MEALDGWPLGRGKIAHLTEEIHMQMGALHHENIRFYIIFSPNNPVILGLPWLRSHNSHISWKDGQIIHWDNTCHEHHLTSITPRPLQSIILTEQNSDIPGLLTEYADLTEAFSKIKASQLPPHRSSDCLIELLPGTTPPKGRIFSAWSRSHESLHRRGVNQRFYQTFNFTCISWILRC